MKMFVTGLIGLVLSACAHGPILKLSQPIVEGPAPHSTLSVGLVADSQLQTRTNFKTVLAYRHPLADRLVEVSMRPPTLDWAARALLLENLHALHARSAQAVFYLGDGANNGCLDELAGGYAADALPGDPPGLLRILDDFRKLKNIPIYFVLGNHDLLGAGSTGDVKVRSDLCSDPTGRNRPLWKSEVIALADQFNRANDRFPAWTYASSYEASVTEGLCGPKLADQHRSWGCYLAGRVNYKSATDQVQFLLLDTNDWANVRRAKFAGLEQLGLWGAMSYKDADSAGVVSQTEWFTRYAGDKVGTRVALMHYDVRSLQKRILGVTLSRLSQRFADLFSSPGNPRTARQTYGVAVSAHTHASANNTGSRRFHVGRDGSESRQSVEVQELNIGSTTDFTNYSTLLSFQPSSAGLGMDYQRIDISKDACGSIWQEAASMSFTRAFHGNQRGWKALGIFPTDRRAYRSFAASELPNLWANLDEFAGGDLRRAACIGLLAAAQEKKRPWPLGLPTE